MNEELYSKITDALVDKGYIIIPNALPIKLMKELLDVSRDESAYKNAGISSSENLHIDTTKRRDKTVWIDEDGATLSEYLAFSEGLKEYLNRTLYLGLSYYESHFAIYEKGDFYEKHLDAFQGSKNRVVTTVLYLNEEWSEADGGELIIYGGDDQKVEKVVPKMGTLVVFLSDTFPHEVLPTNKKRHSIAGWFRVDKR
jgi:SM-20-related protein